MTKLDGTSSIQLHPCYLVVCMGPNSQEECPDIQRGVNQTFPEES